MMTLEKYLTKNFEIFFRGYPLFGPSKCSISKNDYPSTAYDPTFLLQNPCPLKKCGCLQKPRAQSVGGIKKSPKKHSQQFFDLKSFG